MSKPLASLLLACLAAPLAAADLPPGDAVAPVRLLEVARYSEGVVFDAEGNGYISHEDRVTRFTLDGKTTTFAVTGNPNGHKILPDGTHLLCDGTGRVVLKLAADGTVIGPASKGDDVPLRGPNDISLDLANDGFYFTDPGDSTKENPVGTVRYVRGGKTTVVAEGLAYPNGIVLTPDGKRLLVAESRENRVLEYAVVGPGTLGERRVFADLPTKAGEQTDNQPDGMCLDAAGNLYVAHYGMGQVQVLDPAGKLLRRYATGLVADEQRRVRRPGPRPAVRDRRREPRREARGRRAARPRRPGPRDSSASEVNGVRGSGTAATGPPTVARFAVRGLAGPDNPEVAPRSALRFLDILAQCPRSRSRSWRGWSAAACTRTWRRRCRSGGRRRTRSG